MRSGRRAERLVDPLAVLHEVEVIGAGDDDETLGLGRTRVKLTHTGDRDRRVILAGDDQERDSFSTSEAHRDGDRPGRSGLAAGGRERYDRTQSWILIGRRDRGPAAETVPGRADARRIDDAPAGARQQRVDE